MKVLPALLACIMAAPAAPAAAGQTSSDDLHKAQSDVQSYATCIVRFHKEDAKAALLENDDNVQLYSRHRNLIDPSCLPSGVEFQFRGDHLRYALAEALILRDFKDRGPSDFADRAPLTQLRFPDAIRPDGSFEYAGISIPGSRAQDAYNTLLAAAELSRYGECIVRAKPAEARLWALAEPDSSEEPSRIADLAATFDACLVPPGATLKIPRETLRGSVALNYYRLAYEPPQTSSGALH